MTAHTPRLKYGLIALATMLLAACGTLDGDRAVSGGAIGAGTGAAIGAVFFGVGAIPGAVVGGSVGAGTGVVTTPQQVNLGQPVWSRGQAQADENREYSSN